MHVHVRAMHAEAFLYETKMNSVWVCSVEGIQRSGSAALGSPSVNRDVGTAGPVYISSILTGTSQAGQEGTA